MKKRGLYIVTEANCMNPLSGAGQHIKSGFAELRNRFDIDLLTLFKEAPEPTTNNGEAVAKDGGKQGAAWGSLKDLFKLFRNHIGFFSYLSKIRASKVDFIYERCAYLNFNGLIAARLLGLKHFYEVNGLQYLDAGDFYNSWLSPLAKALEVSSYKRSDHCFFVGSIAKSLAYGSDNYTAIENGISSSFLEQMHDSDKAAGEILNFCFVGHLMPYNRFDTLVKALDHVQHGKSIHLNIAGENFEPVLKELESKTSLSYHGKLSADELINFLREQDVGIITGGREHTSFMKLPEYGSASLCVIAPDHANLKQHFGEDLILYFDQNDPKALAARMDEACKQQEGARRRGRALRQLIEKEYTWDLIYEEVSKDIRMHLGD